MRRLANESLRRNRIFVEPPGFSLRILITGKRQKLCSGETWQTPHCLSEELVTSVMVILLRCIA
jgi:hypothetical protein